MELWIALLIAGMALLLGVVGGERQVTRVRGKETDTPDGADQLVSAEETEEKEVEEGFVTSDGPRETVHAVGYVSVPKTGGDDAAELERQAEAVQRLCERRGWELLHVVRDVENGHAKGMERPGLLYALSESPKARLRAWSFPSWSG